MWTGLTAVRDPQLGSCLQREMLWCASHQWIVHWLSQLVLCRTSRLNFLAVTPTTRDVDELMIDLGCLNLRYLSDSGLYYIRRFLIKFLLLLRCKLMRVCCQLPSCSVVPLPLSLPVKRLVHLPPSSFSPHLFSTSDSVRNFPVTSSSATGLGVDVGCAFGFVVDFVSLFGIVSALLLATDSFSVSDFESFPSSSRSSMVFSPAVGYVLLLPAAGYAFVLPAVGFGSFDFPLLLGMLFSRSSYSCCFIPSTHHWLSCCGSVSDSSSVTLW